MIAGSRNSKEIVKKEETGVPRDGRKKQNSQGPQESLLALKPYKTTTKRQKQERKKKKEEDKEGKEKEKEKNELLPDYPCNINHKNACSQPRI